MARKTVDSYYCDQCGMEHIKWVGRCTSCKEWNTIKTIKYAKNINSLPPLDKRSIRHDIGLNEPFGESSHSQTVSSSWLVESSPLLQMNEINCVESVQRIQLFSSELNRVLGGGLVRSSVILLAGEPGIGKSTLLLQLASSVAQLSKKVVYVSGEETAQQIVSRSQRLSMKTEDIFLLCDTNLDRIIDRTINGMDDAPALMIVDSIQTMQCADNENIMGGITQIRQCAAKLLQLAKSTGTVVILVGHVTKSGEVAGPRVLEHMVDVVLYVEGIEQAEYRLVRSMKNRFGSASEVGIFSMTNKGLVDEPNPSKLFMSSSMLSEGLEGSAVAIVMEGTRPILAEIQCLVGGKKQARETGIVSPRRAADGFPLQRLSLIIAVIEKHLRLSLWNRDVYLNVVGGLKISEPLSDLAVAVSVTSSLVNLRVKAATAFIGEIGLGGEIRSGRSIELRIAEAVKLGFKKLVLPKTSGWEAFQERYGKVIELIPCASLKETLSAGLELGQSSFDEIVARQKQHRKKRSPQQEADLESEDDYDEFDL